MCACACCSQFDACSDQWSATARNISLGVQYGGFISDCKTNQGISWRPESWSPYHSYHRALKECVRAHCNVVFPASEPSLARFRAGCLWQVDWFEVADNPSIRSRPVECPAELVIKAGAHAHARARAPVHAHAHAHAHAHTHAQVMWLIERPDSNLLTPELLEATGRDLDGPNLQVHVHAHESESVHARRRDGTLTGPTCRCMHMHMQMRMCMRGDGTGPRRVQPAGACTCT